MRESGGRGTGPHFFGGKGDSLEMMALDPVLSLLLLLKKRGGGIWGTISYKRAFDGLVDFLGGLRQKFFRTCGAFSEPPDTETPFGERDGNAKNKLSRLPSKTRVART